jgi:hypothetical protein
MTNLKKLKIKQPMLGMATWRFLATKTTKSKTEKTTKKINVDKIISQSNKNDNKNDTFNEVGVQMINERIRSHLFGPRQPKDPLLIKKAIEHLKKFDLGRRMEKVKDISDIELPKLYGSNLDEHFRYIARQQSAFYHKLMNMFINQTLPRMPENFEHRPGWTKLKQFF